MNVARRVMISIKGKIGSSLTLFFIILLLGTLVLASISIRSAIHTTTDVLRTRLPGIATLNSARAEGRLDPSVIHEIGNFSYVRAFDYSLSQLLYSTELTMIQLEGSDSEIGMSPHPTEGVENFLLKGVHYPKVIDIEEGAINLVEGRTFTEEEIRLGTAALVSEYLAEKNDLRLGQIITFEAFVHDWARIDGRPFFTNFNEMQDYLFARQSVEVEIVGIFSIAGALVEDNVDYLTVDELETMVNRIYVPNVVTIDAHRFIFENEQEQGYFDWFQSGSADQRLWFNPIFVLNDPRDLELFYEEVTQLLPEGWVVSDLRSTYSNVAHSMQMMEEIAEGMLWAIGGGIVLITTLILLLFFRDRKFEIGVYLALGERKVKIVVQMILEVFIVTLSAMTLSLFTGQLLADGLSRELLQHELLAPMENNEHLAVQSDQNLTWYNSGEVSIEALLEIYNITLAIQSSIIFYALGLTTVLFGTVIPIVYIIRLNPKKILI